ncbi:MAG TPA: glycosyl hydrolase family 8 [Nocardioides sp.]
MLPGPARTPLAVVAVASVVSLALAGCGGTPSSAGGGTRADTSSTPTTSLRSSSGAAMTAADAFLSRYVTADGRVLRRDQGNDVVSEGQAYGMLIAELAGRPDVVRSIWSWTHDHLARSDGLLSYHADEQGNVLDEQAASDADTLAAYALQRYAGTDAAALHARGRALAEAVLRHETVRSSAGDLVLTAGPWATGSTPVVDPSYLMPSVFTDLAGLTGDDRWDDLGRTSIDLVDALTEHGRQLPPDWARMEGDRLVASGSGGGGGSPQYGPDAQRVPLWFGAACDPRARGLAGAWWKILQQDDRSAATALGPTGDPVDPSPSTVALVASAASARAAGDTGGAADLETGAQQSDAGRPTYYGGAWLVLGPALWDGRLTSCR